MSSSCSPHFQVHHFCRLDNRPEPTPLVTPPQSSDDEEVMLLLMIYVVAPLVAFK